MMPKNSNNRLLVKLVGIVALMVSASFVAVPFYNWFCRTTGYAGTPRIAEGPLPDRVLDRKVTVRFDANVGQGMPWEFKPVDREMTLKLGETGLAFYEAYNPTDQVVAGTASFNVAPDAAGYFFTKIECFCFTEQILQPGERVQMPVSFYVDPDMVNDRDAKRVTHITLSYTFHKTDLPGNQAALAAPKSATDVN